MYMPVITARLTVCIYQLLAASAVSQTPDPPLASVKDRALYVLENEDWHRNPEYWDARGVDKAAIPESTPGLISAYELDALKDLVVSIQGMDEREAALIRYAEHRNEQVAVSAQSQLNLMRLRAWQEANPMTFDRRDDRQFSVHLGPIEDDTPGALKFGGYCHREVRVTKVDYRVNGPYSGGASVEVVNHASDYPYAVHDLFGFIRAAAGHPIPTHGPGRQPAKRSSPPTGQWRLLEWRKSPEASAEIILCAIGENRTEYAAAWYSKSHGSLTTIIVCCGSLRGWPVSVINEYLEKYPSNLTTDPSQIEDWEAADLHKWIDILRTQREDKIILQFTMGQLMRYREQEAFGIFNAMSSRNDPATLDQRLDQVIANIEAYIADHPEYRQHSNVEHQQSAQ